MTPDDRDDVVAEVTRRRAVAVMRLTDHDAVVAVGRALQRGGIVVMELTLGLPSAPDALAGLVADLEETALVGAGTVTSVAQVEEAARAGARFCVSPHTDPELIEAALDAGVEPIPGAGTATEVMTAQRAGARLIKVFPAAPLGPGFVAALRGPLPDVRLVPTGGIAHDDILPWLRAGATAVGLGSDLVPRTTSSDLDGIEARARVVVNQVADFDDRVRQ